jgi:hypothetical protein
MTTPPDYGGLEFEEGLQEDLGVPAEKHRDHQERDWDRDRDRDGLASDDNEDNEAHAPDQVCARCGAVIASGQDVRHRADGRWVHEVCPPDLTQVPGSSP